MEIQLEVECDCTACWTITTTLHDITMNEIHHNLVDDCICNECSRPAKIVSVSLVGEEGHIDLLKLEESDLW